MPLESAIVNSILKYLNGLPEGVAEKIQGSAFNSGKSDINACYKGYSIRIEVKTPDNGNKASKKQSINLKRWNCAGAYTLVAYSLKDVKNLIKRIDTDVQFKD